MWLLGGVLLALGSSTSTRAQPPPNEAHVQPVKGLDFGQLLPGADTHVGPADPGRGELQVEGRGKYQLHFLLPDELSTPGGATLEIGFGALDAAVRRGTAGAFQEFDPNDGVTLMLTGTVRDAQIFLGGTVMPAADQARGRYSANVTVVMARN